MDPWTLAFLVGGALLIASELIVPSLFTVFLGVAALMTAGLRGVGLVESVPISFLIWSVISLGLVLPFRPLVQKFLPGGKSDVKKDRTDVEHDRGRIRFQGTTWQARMVTGSLKKGERAQLVYREGSIWMIEAIAVEGTVEGADARDLFAVEAAPETIEKKR